MSNLKIKKIGISEIYQLQKISKETFIETFDAYNTVEDMQEYLNSKLSIEKLTLEIQNPNSEFYFAIINNKIIGYLKLNYADAQTEIIEQKTLEVERVYILKEFQGKKVGQALLETALEKANIIQAEFIWLAVWEKNENAIGFYKKNNFEDFGTHIFQLGKDAQTDILMKLYLN
jgi:ribosomal protein S18 acetylase RimI-like enzyme